jgi:hypothetical protein
VPHDSSLARKLDVTSARGSNPRLGQGLFRVALAALVAITTVVLGWAGSVWLVPPYLLLIGWLLVPSRHQQRTLDATTAETAITELVEQLPDSVQAEHVPTGDSLESLSSKTAKTRTRRSRARPKVKLPQDLDTPAATWVQVGPGKFIRVEGPGPALAGSRSDREMPGDHQDPPEEVECPPPSSESNTVGGWLESSGPTKADEPSPGCSEDIVGPEDSTHSIKPESNPFASPHPDHPRVPIEPEAQEESSSREVCERPEPRASQRVVGMPRRPRRGRGQGSWRSGSINREGSRPAFESRWARSRRLQSVRWARSRAPPDVCPNSGWGAIRNPSSGVLEL